MSEDRLERAVQEMQQEDVDTAALEGARARVWEKLTAAGRSTCAEFRPDFGAYLSGELGGSRRVLLEDHLSRCPACRTWMAGTKGERRVVAMPRRSPSRWVVRWGSLAAAAVVLFGLLYLGRGAVDRLMAPGGPRATVVSADGGLYRLPQEALAAGAPIGEGEWVRTGPGAHAVLRLADGSLVDVNERTEFFVTAAWSGRAIHLQRGDLVVRAAKQRRGSLRVLTRDSIASVKGTVFAVSAGMGGSVVSVVEGSVAVNQPGREVLLSPGEQAASNPALATSIEEAVAWSPSAEEYLAILGSLATIERELAHFPPELRTTSSLLPSLPAAAVVYGAIPNLGGTIGRAVMLADQQSAENAAFAAWWTSGAGRTVRQIVDRVQSISSLLGDEIAFCAGAPGPADLVPIVMARLQPGKRAEVASALEGLFAGTGEAALSYSVTDDLVVASESPSDLAWALGHLGQGAGSAFAAAIGEKYRRGAGSLLAIDAPPLVAMLSGDDAPPVELAGMIGMKYIFLEQRAPMGAEENEITFAFEGRRTGMASWLADSGSGGAAEYLPADTLVAGYVSTREPWQLVEELIGLLTGGDPSFGPQMTAANETLGPGFVENLARAMGTEGAFALNGFSLNGPAWVAAVLANNPPVIDASLQKLVETVNHELAAAQQDQRLALAEESAGGRVWNTISFGTLPWGLTWTYDGGYLIAASERGAAERAIATRHGGSPLVWSPEFLGQLPSSAGIHPSAFAWLNTKGALGVFSSLAGNQALATLLAERDPVLVTFDGSADRIHAASRTRLSKVIMDVMLLERLGAGTREGLPPTTAGQ